MAVFGAPRELAHKERSAVAAALEIVDTIERRQVADLAASELRLGVGVATGPAYVGTVQSIDRKIWCVIGNTTNLAARLQAMTKDLGVSLLIDDATRRAAGALAAGFSERELRVRGRAERVRAHLAPGPLARAFASDA
jgi:adenylate cyclase